MKATKRNSPLWAYLNERGVLERGNEDEICKAKKEYRREYLKAYKKRRNKTTKEFSISCNPKETKAIVTGALEHALLPSTFIKKAVFAYLEKSYITPHIHMLHLLQQILLRSESLIRRIAEKDKSTSWFRSNNSYSDLEAIIRDLQSQVTHTLTNPPKQ